MRWLIPLLLVASSCGGPSTTADEGDDVPDDRPRLDGALVLDVSLDAAHADARSVWQVAERLLEDRGPQPPDDLGVDGYMDWMRAVFSPWLEGRVAVMRDLREKFQALADAGPGERVFSAVVAGYLYQDFARLIEGLPVPVEIEGDRQMRQAFAAQLRAQAGPAWRRAREAWARCVDWAPDAPEELRGWGDACAARLAEVPELEEPEPAPVEIDWPDECLATPGGQPDRIDPGPTARRPVALIVQDRGPLTRDERDRVADAVFRRLRRTERGLRLLPMRQVRRARDDAEASRNARGNDCARPPTAVDLLRARHEDLMPGAVSMDCLFVDGERVCALQVYLGKKDDGSTWYSSARLDEVSFDVDDWLAAVDELEDGAVFAAVLGVAETGSVAGAVQLRGVSGYGEWGDVDVRAAMRPVARPLAACRDAGDAPPVDMSVVLEVAPDGAVSDIDIDPGPYGDPRRDCVVAALEDLELPEGSGERRVTFRLAFYPEAPVAVPYRVGQRQPHPFALHVREAFSDRFLRDALSRCLSAADVESGSVAAYQASLGVSPDGTVSSVDLEALAIPDGVTEEVSACIRAALPRARFSCTPNGEEATVETTVCLGAR